MAKYSTMLTVEVDLLRPVDPAQHSDDWPIFTLKNAEVFPSDSSTEMVSLLTANATTPLTIRGKLAPIPRELAHLRLQGTLGKTERFKLQEVRQFSYGQYEDGEIEVWAAGKAGWYSIKPSKAYGKIYEDMIEAVKLMYYCTDQYASGARKKAKNKIKAWSAITVESILEKYALESGLGGREDAAALFSKHARFLLSTMMRATKQDGIMWESTSLFHWMASEFSDVVAEVREQQQAALQANPPQEKIGTKRKRSVVATPTADTTAGAMTPNDTSDAESIASTKRRGRKGKSILRPRTTSKYVESLAEDAPGLVASNMEIAEAPAFERSPLAREKSRATPSVAPSEAEFDEGIDMPLDMEQTMDDLSDSSIHVRIRPEHLKATRPGDIWSCPLDGCMHQIYAASQSQQLIKEHYRLHVEDEDAEIRLELVRKMQAPGLPVNRLLSRIQRAGQSGFPSPIVQRY